jgi:trehalose synthase-fused probable maltokinase
VGRPAWARELAGLPVERIAEARWFAQKGAAIERVGLLEAIELAEGVALLVVEVATADGVRGEYALPVRATATGLVEAAPGDGVYALLARGAPGLVGDGIADLPAGADERPLGSDQSNTTVALDGRLAAKCYRRLAAGPHPEVELVTYLSHTRPVAGVPAARGALAWPGPDGEERALLLVQDLVPDAVDGWTWVEGLLGALLDGGDTATAVVHATDVGALTARLQRALADAGDEPGFAPRAASADERTAWREAAGRQLERALELVPPDVRDELRAATPAIGARLDALAGPAGPLLTRVHGDYHLGQLLHGPHGLAVVDFEGEPGRDLAERRALASPLRDLAGLLRSYDHLARMVLRRRGDVPAEVEPAERWVADCREQLLAAYAAGVAGSLLVPDGRLLDAFEVEKEVYEFVYAATFLPVWLYAPRAAMRALLRTPSPA